MDAPSSSRDPSVCLDDIAPPPDEGYDSPFAAPEEPLNPSPGDAPGCADDALEPNNDPGAAHALDIGMLSETNGRQCGGDDWYSFALDAGVGLQVRVTFDSTEADLDMYLYVQGETRRLVDASETVFDEEVVWLPPQDAPTTVLIRVVNFGGVPASYTLRSPLFGRPSNDACATPQMLTSGAQVMSSTVGATNGITFDGRSCTGYRNEGGDLFYAVAVPQGHKLRASVVSDEDLAIYVLDSCETRCCWAGSDFMDNGEEEIVWTNESGADRVVIVGVDSFDPRIAAPFTLSVDVNP